MDLGPDHRSGWSSGAVAGSLLAGAAISALMLGKERVTGQPSDLIQWERAWVARLGAGAPAAPPDLTEQLAVHAGHMALSAAGGVAYAAAFDQDASPVASGLAFGAAFYIACHWIAGPLMRLKPLEWREPPAAVVQHLVVHAAYGILIALGARRGAHAERLRPISRATRIVRG